MVQSSEERLGNDTADGFDRARRAFPAVVHQAIERIVNAVAQERKRCREIPEYSRTGLDLVRTNRSTIKHWLQCS
jgi:hypothetical protein